MREAVSYGPWGEARDWDNWAQTVPDEVLETLASGFTGHQPELDTGLINMRGRMYSPEIARFMSVDPVIESAGDAQTWNAYSYVQNDPLGKVDPSGYGACPPLMCPIPDIDISGGGGSGESEPAKRRSAGLPSDPVPSGSTDTGPFGPGSTGCASPGGGGGKSGGGSSMPSNGRGQGGPSGENYRMQFSVQGGPSAEEHLRASPFGLFIFAVEWLVQAQIESQNRTWWDRIDYEDIADAGQRGLDGVGFAPHPYAQIADGVNALWYLFEGDVGNATISVIGIVNEGAKAPRMASGLVEMSAKVGTRKGARVFRHQNADTSAALGGAPWKKCRTLSEDDSGLKDHARRHSDLSPEDYLRRGQANIERGQMLKGGGKHPDAQYWVRRVGDDAYSLTITDHKGRILSIDTWQSGGGADDAGRHRTRAVEKRRHPTEGLLGEVLMSRGRMQDLLDALRLSGWRLVDPEKHSSASMEPFALEDDKAKWGVESNDGTLAEIDFYAFGDLGQPTDDLRDILYCVEVGSGRKLYFDKRESPEWKANLSEFVRFLGKDVSDHDAPE